MKLFSLVKYSQICSELKSSKIYENKIIILFPRGLRTAFPNWIYNLVLLANMAKNRNDGNYSAIYPQAITLDKITTEMNTQF